MSITLNISEGAQAIPPAGANIVARIGVSSAGTDNSVTEWEGGQDTLVAPVLGYGPLTEDTARASRVAGEHSVAVKAHAGTAGTKSAVDAKNAAGSGAATGPTPTVAGNPTDSLVLRGKITKGGALGVAKIKFAYDGYTYGAELDIPAQLPATVRGTIDLTTITPSVVNTKTFIATPDGGAPVTVTFAAVATIADIVSQIDASALSARLVAGKYLEVSGVTLGSAGSLDVGSGTANSDLGFTDSPLVNGTNSTIVVAKTGLTYTFLTGTYVLDETYTVTTVAPRMSISEAMTAADALRASGVPFGILEICQDPIDGADLLAWQQALDAKVSSWHNASADRIFPVWLIGSPLGGTGDSAIATNDTDVRTANAGYETLYSAGVAHGDMYVTGAEYPGSHRRSLRVPLSEVLAAARLSADPGNGALPPLPQCSMVGPDGVTKARDELFATIKMEDNYTTATRRDKKPRIKSGVTRAASTSKFKFPGVLRMAYVAAFTVYRRMLQFENADLDLAPTGKLREPIAAAIEKLFTNDLKLALVEESHASDALATVDRTKVADNQGKYPLTINFQAQEKGQVRDVIGNLSVTTALRIS